MCWVIFLLLHANRFFLVQRVKPINDDTFFQPLQIVFRISDRMPSTSCTITIFCLHLGWREKRTIQWKMLTHERTNDWWFGYKVYRLNDILDLLWWILFSQHFFIHVDIFFPSTIFFAHSSFSFNRFRFDMMVQIYAKFMCTIVYISRTYKICECECECVRCAVYKLQNCVWDATDELCNKCNPNIDILSLEVFQITSFAVAEANKCMHKI